ncbi:ankyrin repeat domain-containing protein [Nostoc sp. UCD121]|uniref:ankyrin repeat domain-containing protein n=1 Tax=unclassified Nostoc TaxID=2593658 RepID=UPI00162924F9|nr:MULTISPECIES: ankyrin repeat domain-containing protein [unclassified Nostoc]MBC1224135.1 ankyrin repeat domain-containing protein [Nostoc sp. UCD120]MBC1276949.1 ankyrin repeat domain-containing protein [Nostoc sp. UCD121]MBC1293932.1 ankyrin repeat domain-containing protein [Nostoc sp. UCD122]
MYGDYIIPDEDFAEALIRAIRFHYLEEVQALISVQQDINARDSSELYWSPLIYAVFEESLDIVKLLVKAGADVNIRGSDQDDFPLNLSAYACNNTFFYSNEFIRNKKIFDYLAPLTSPELKEIAQRTLNRRN